MNRSVALALALFAACRAPTAPPLEPDQLRVHWAACEPREVPMSLPAADERWQSGWTYDEAGLRERLGVRFAPTARIVRLGERADWDLSAGLHSSLRVEHRPEEAVYTLEWNLLRDAAPGALEARTELAPREELVYFSIPPRGSPEPIRLVFLALHGPALDSAPKRASCCRETH